MTNQLDAKVFNLLAVTKAVPILSATLDLQQLAETALDILIEMGSSMNGALYLTDGSGIGFYRAATKSVSGVVFPPEVGGDSALVQHIGEQVSDAFVWAWEKSRRVFPFRCEGRLMGFFVLHGQIDVEPWDQDKEEIVATLAAHVAVCIRNAKLTAHLEAEVANRTRDIQAANQELAEASTLLNNVLESSTEYAIIAKDLDGNILTWNEGARRNYGYSADDMVGKMNSRILHTPEDITSGKVQGLLDTALSTGKAEGVFERIRKNGERFAASVAVTLRRDANGVPVGYLLISKDITEQKALEEQLRRKNEELEEQYLRVQRANRLKSEFLANMSHELRTPLNGIIGFTELMHDGKLGPISPEQKEYMGDILTSARHLLQLINDVLDLSKVESGKMEFHPERVDIAGLVGEVRDILRTLAAQKRIRVDTQIDPAVTGITLDPSKLKQILYNYLSNALKFTLDEGQVTVRVVTEESDRFRLEVEDTGIGIRPDDMDKLFTEFQQLDASTAKKYPGTGLGLALTKRIVEAQGGHVGARSIPGEGSVFFTVLPRVAEPVGDVEVEPLPTRSGAPKILVVDDDAKDRAWLVRTLTGAGYTVDVAGTGKEALAKCRGETFDAITLDLMLPDIGGRDVLAAVRAKSLNVNTPVIIVSVAADKSIGVGFQVSDILLKPVQSDRLLESLQRARVAANASRPILVVDDDPQALKVAERMLKQLGYRPVCRSDAEGGLQAAEQEPPSAVILDLLMPEMDGFEFLKRFRRTTVGRQTPVIVWTVKDLSRQERDRLKASARAIVMKSQGATALIEELQSCVPPPPVGAHAEEGRRAR